MSDEMHEAHDDATPVTHGIARRDALKAMAAAAMVPMLPEPAAIAIAAGISNAPGTSRNSYFAPAFSRPSATLASSSATMWA